MPCPPPRDLPDPEIEPGSLLSAALADEFFTTLATWEARYTRFSPVKILQVCKGHSAFQGSTFLILEKIAKGGKNSDHLYSVPSAEYVSLGSQP